MTLSLYVGRRFLWHFMASFLAFGALSFVIDAAALMDELKSADLGFSGTLRLAFLRMPINLYNMLPIVAVLASILTFLGLARSRELVAVRAAGRSATALLLPVGAVALAIGVVAVSVWNPLAASSFRMFETETARHKSGSISAFSLSRKGLWLRQSDPQTQTVIFAKRANFDGTLLSGVTFFEFDANGIAQRRIEAGFARLETGAWTLGNGKVWLVNAPGQVPDRTAKAFQTLSIPSDLTSDEILDTFGDTAAVSVWDLPGFIARLEQSGFSGTRHRVAFQAELATPIFILAMVLLGAAFTMRHPRAGRVGISLLVTVMAALGAFIFQDFTQVLGANAGVSILAAAWGPPVASLFLAFGLVVIMEEG